MKKHTSQSFSRKKIQWMSLIASSIIIFVFGTAKLTLLVLSELSLKGTRHEQVHENANQNETNLLSGPLFTEEFTLKEDPVGNPIGKPTLDPSKSFLALGSKAMVACDVPLCSTMGKNILLRGGNAADAAITVALCIGSVNLHSSGIGGGGYIVSSKGNSTISIDAREMAPGKAHKNMYRDSPTSAMFGGLAVAVPGELAGLYKLFTEHGSGNLTWQDLFEPVIRLNRNGWTADLIWVHAAQKMHELVLSKAPSLEQMWDFIYNDNGSLVEAGDHIRRPNYADTLEMISKNGSHAIFYDPYGPFAPRLAQLASTTGGIIEPQDFANYEVKVSSALSYKFSARGLEYELFTTSGVSSGLALIAGLGFYTTLAENLPIAENDTVLQQHRLVEAMKWTSSARSHLGDVNETYWKEVVDKYTSKQWAESIIEENRYSDNTTFGWKHYQPLYEVAGKHGTSSFSVVDENDNSVSMTTTVNLLFGSMVYDNKTGIILNDEMDDFSIPHNSNAFNLTPSVLNFVQPHHRPLSLMSPTIIKKNGKTDFLIGAAGGSRIVTAILQAIVRNIFDDIPLLNVIAYSRIHHQLIPAFVMVENRTTYNEEFISVKNTENCLAKKGHDFYESGALTAMNGIKRAGDLWHGVSDYWRKHGIADGY